MGNVKTIAIEGIVFARMPYIIVEYGSRPLEDHVRDESNLSYLDFAYQLVPETRKDHRNLRWCRLPST